MLLQKGVSTEIIIRMFCVVEIKAALLFFFFLFFPLTGRSVYGLANWMFLGIHSSDECLNRKRERKKEVSVVLQSDASIFRDSRVGLRVNFIRIIGWYNLQNPSISCDLRVGLCVNCLLVISGAALLHMCLLASQGSDAVL